MDQRAVAAELLPEVTDVQIQDAILGWTVVSSCVLLASFYLAPAPPAPADNPNLAVNLNYVHGLSYDKPQTVMPPWLWLGIMLAGFPVVFYLPTHLALSAWFPMRVKAVLGDDCALSSASSNQGCAPCC